ncbi:MAG: sarcosine oxidase subunit gamma [Alphaproteobacteria bacterium]|nr:sarcosine oxidase subunit gamma [Alphaproteobacteria bacterium]
MADPSAAATASAPQISPLQAEAAALAAASAPGIAALREVPFLAQIGLRGDPAAPAFAGAIRDALGLALPTTPNRIAERDGVAALWLGPDEWLVVGAPGSAAVLSAALDRHLAGQHASAVDLGASRACLEVTGMRAAEVLAKGCALDLHPRAFGPADCAQTLLARIPVILHRTHTEPGWRLFVRRSFAPYIAAWLIDAVAEYRGKPNTRA